MTGNDNIWVADGTDITTPNPARMYDYFLGGHHNFQVDRKAAAQVLQVNPLATKIAHANRAFLRRAVRFMLDEGIDQFLDIGSGIPTTGNVHEIAQQHNPDACIVYVDIDPVAVEHSQAILQDNANATVIQADARQPGAILNHSRTQRMLDFTRPVGLLLVGMLYFIADDASIYRLTRDFYRALPPGSLIAISHLTDEHISPEAENALKVYKRSSSPVRVRSRAQIATIFGELELVKPGITWLPEWRPEGKQEQLFDRPEDSMGYAGVGRKL